MKLTWYGTASLSMETAAGALLVDPFVPFRGSSTPPADYRRFDTVLVTHGHFDHIMSLPALAKAIAMDIYCTQTPAATLRRLGVPGERLHAVAPGDAFELAGMRVTVYPSRHVRFDRGLVARTLCSVRMLRHIGNLPRAARGFLRFPENGETVAYRIEAESKAAFILGSLNLDPDAEYPTGADVLVLPYQGASDLLTPALAIIERLRPKAVLLDHFDDAFPPISAAIDTSDIENALAGRLPVHRLAPGGHIEIA